jgi:serine/threonine protein kinase
MVAIDPASNANLLLGLVALQNEIITRPDLIAAVRQWIPARGRTLGAILLERRALSTDQLAEVESLVERALQEHGDIEPALAAVRCPRSVRIALEGIADDDLYLLLSHTCSRGDGEGTLAAGTAAPTATPPAMPTSTPLTAAAVAAPPGGLPFRIIKALKGGSLGSLVVVRDEGLERDLVIKQIRDDLADDNDALARFNREVKYTAILEHAGIVPVYRAGRDTNGHPYYAMRYIKGRELRAAIDECHQKHGPERLEAMTALLPHFVTVCRAIGYAHARKVLHRDIKPANIMLSDAGEAIVIDWSLAKSIDSGSTTDAAQATLSNRAGRDDNPTKVGQFIGTPRYMSPETAAGDLERVGPHSDVFSLGATLFHLLTGTTPAGNPSLKHFKEPRAVWSEVPRPLQAICLKAMANDPRQRYRTACALADDVERWLSGKPVDAMPERASLTSRLGGSLQRHPLRLAAVTAVVFAVAGAAGMKALDPTMVDAGDKVQASQQTPDEKDRMLELEREEHARQMAAASADTERARGDRDAAARRADAAQQNLVAATRRADEWEKKHEEAVAIINSLNTRVVAEQAELKLLRAEKQRGQRQVEALLDVARRKFQRSDELIVAAFTAYKALVRDSKSKPAQFAAALAFAQLQRQLCDMHVVLEDFDEAQSEYKDVIESLEGLEKADPKAVRQELAFARHNLAWLLVTAKREPALAVRRAKEAVDAEPRDDFRLTHAMALYRNGEPKAARDILLTAKGNLKGDDYDTCLLFLAMVDCQLPDHRPEATRWLHEAQDRLAGRPFSRELERFRREADEQVSKSK